MSFFYYFVALIVLLLATACQGGGAEPTGAPMVPTAVITAAPILESAPTSVPTAASAATATALPAPTQTPTSGATATALATAMPIPTLAYQVIYVAADDMLNVRSGPGANNAIVGRLSPNEQSIRVSGRGVQVNGSSWVPIETAGVGPTAVSGWVNSQFLTEMVAPDQFCADDEVKALLDALRTAVEKRDGAALAALVHPEHGLRLRRHWWNPEVQLTADAIDDLFSRDRRQEWGMADGTGDPIVGSFRDILLPLLDRDLLAATAVGCNEILHGSTAGLVQLPDGYQAANYLSAYRPAAAGVIEFDWGSWVIGIERWQGHYFISFLIHFEWEI
jgi:uncharacterized protein YraI